MKTNNPVLDTLIEGQTQFMNNWLESVKKMQSSVLSGKAMDEGQSLYKEYFDKQLNVLNNLQASAGNLNGSQENNPVEFFRNWFNRQADYARQMAEFNLNLQNNVTNSGKVARDYIDNFTTGSSSFNNIYNNWLNAVNSTYETLSKSMNADFGKDVFSRFVAGNKMYAGMQEFFQPMADAIRNGQFNQETFKNYFAPESYNQIAKQMFSGLYNEASLRDVYDGALKNLHEFFTVQNNLSKEYFEQLKNVGQNFTGVFDNNQDLKSLYGQFENVFGKTFGPLMQVISPGKEKENAEALINLLDRIARYSIKQAELQTFLQTTIRRSMENTALHVSEKFSDPKKLAEFKGAEELYNDWMKTSEKLFTELFASEEFSKVKGEALNLSMEVRKQFEERFEHSFSYLPLVFKSEVEELQKTVYLLKKQIKELQEKLSHTSELHEEAGSSKGRRK